MSSVKYIGMDVRKESISIDVPSNFLETTQAFESRPF